MDCTIRVINGPDTGASCTLQPGVNIIGRSPSAAMRLTAEDISWEHLSITRNGDQCTIENLSALGTWLGDARVTGPVRLRLRDRLRLSKDTILRFEAGAGGPEGLLAGRRGWVVALLVVLAVAGAAAWSIFGQPANADWNGAYLKIYQWTEDQADARGLPPEVPTIFADAWHMEIAQDYVHSRGEWLKLKMLLDSAADSFPLAKENAGYGDALNHLLTPPRHAVQEPDDQEMAAALCQFVARRLNWSTEQSKSQKSER